MRKRIRRLLPVAVWALGLACAGGQAISVQEDEGQALDRLKAQAEAQPERVDLLLMLGNAAANAGKLDVALASFHKALENLEPDSPVAADLHLRIGETYRRKGDPEAAIAWLTQASELLPDQPVIVGTLALVLDGCGRKEEAAHAYRAAIELDPDNAIAMNNLAFLLAENGEDLDQALAFARRAMDLAPGDVEIIDTAGWVQLKRKQVDAAIGLFAGALATAPENEGLRRHLVLALEAKGERSAAEDDLKGLLSGDVTSAESRRKVCELLKTLEQTASR